ncbi:hypothetical protein A0H81_01853 [Grifola frondosa]|uniref:Uncharacterized protein n=1 Tax=Grifola frondosa TaxID=5627 RepID=A0A1C7MKN2_GRIFR|nr:hypothetical protein A0H81_01853 [Grifola frondosa]
MCLISDVEDMPLLMCFLVRRCDCDREHSPAGCLEDEIGLTSRVIFAEANREVGPISTGQCDVLQSKVLQARWSSMYSSSL